MKKQRNIIRRVAVPLVAVFCCGMGSTNALSAPCGAGRTLPAKTWLMTAPSCEPAAPISPLCGAELMIAPSCTPTDLVNQYGDDIPGTYGTDWISFLWNSAPTAQNYVKQAGTDSLVPGTGNWLYSYKTGTLLLDGTATTTVPCSDYGSGLLGKCFAVDLTPSSDSNLWQIIGHPFPYTVSWADVRVAAASDCTSWTQYTPSQAATANLMTKEYWFWNGSSYQTKDDSTPGSIGVLQPQESIWVRIKAGSSSLNADNFKLLIPARGTTGTVTSATGRIWMDRNLGASRVAQSIDDEEAYGDLYQWGRGTDGHEKRDSNIVDTQWSGVEPVPDHGNFIIGLSSFSTFRFGDWLTTPNNDLWQGVDGMNNPCPTGFRLPTDAEWEAERASWSENNAAGAFASPLKLVAAGCRNRINYGLYRVGTGGGYWSSTGTNMVAKNLCFDSGYYWGRDFIVPNLCFDHSFEGLGGTIIPFQYSNNGIAAINNSNYRNYGFSVRCIKD